MDGLDIRQSQNHHLLSLSVDLDAQRFEDEMYTHSSIEGDDMDIKHIKAIKAATNASIQQCKNALQDAGGDVDAAITIARAWIELRGHLEAKGDEFLKAYDYIDEGQLESAGLFLVGLETKYSVEECSLLRQALSTRERGQQSDLTARLKHPLEIKERELHTLIDGIIADQDWEAVHALMSADEPYSTAYCMGKLAAKGEAAQLQRFLEQGVSAGGVPYRPNEYHPEGTGMPPAFFAAQSHKLETLRLLVEHGAVIDQRLPDGKSILNVAVRWHGPYLYVDPEIMKFARSQGAQYEPEHPLDVQMMVDLKEKRRLKQGGAAEIIDMLQS